MFWKNKNYNRQPLLPSVTLIASQDPAQLTSRPTVHIETLAPQPPRTNALPDSEPERALGPLEFHNQTHHDPALPTSGQQPPHKLGPRNQPDQGPARLTLKDHHW